MTVPTLTTRRPTGLPPHPMLLVAGVEKAGKSYGAALFSSSDLIDRTFYIEVGEGAADQYGAIPGVRYEIVEHDGTFKGIANAAWAATQQPRGDRPHAIVIDNVTEVWDLLTEEAQAKANRRAAAKAAERKKPAPAEDVQITMDLWNEAKKKWRRFLEVLRVYDGPVVLLARLELVAVMDGNAPAKDGAREWKIRAEKNLPYEVDAIVKMTAPQQAALTGVRSTVVQVPPGSELPLPQFTIDGLLRRMGLGEPGATAPRSYTAPRAVLDDSATERPAQRQQPSGPQTDQWSTPPASSAPAPPPGPDGAAARPSEGQLANLAIEFGKHGIIGRNERLAHTSQLLGRPIESFNDLTLEECRTVSKALRSGWPSINHHLVRLPDVPAEFEENPVRDILVANIADANSPATLDEAGRDVAAELARGGITPAEGEWVKVVWKARKAQLQAGPAPAAQPGPGPAPVGSPDNPGIADYQRRMLEGVANRQQHTPAAMIGLAQQHVRGDITDLSQLSKAEAERFIHLLTTGEKAAA